MGLGFSLQVWQANIDGGGVISKMAHVGHKTHFPPCINQPHVMHLS